MNVMRGDEVENSAPVPGMTEYAVGTKAGARGVWLAHVTTPPGSGISPVHHHRESEALIHMLSGTLTIIHGPELRDRIDLGPGDFLFIPPFTLHAETNLGPEEAELVMARSTPEPIAEWHPELNVPESVLAAAVPR
jgi:uncharacterized RmlC-like cupin family protein